MAPKLTQETIEKYKASFDTFVEEKTGLLENTMIERALRYLGFNPNKTEVKYILADVSKVSGVDFETFCYIAFHVGLYSNTEKELIKAFTAYDHHGTGTLHVDLVRQILTKKNNPLTEIQVDHLFAALKIVKNQVNIKELARTLLDQ